MKLIIGSLVYAPKNTGAGEGRYWDSNRTGFGANPLVDRKELLLIEWQGGTNNRKKKTAI